MNPPPPPTDLLPFLKKEIPPPFLREDMTAVHLEIRDEKVFLILTLRQDPETGEGQTEEEDLTRFVDETLETPLFQPNASLETTEEIFKQNLYEIVTSTNLPNPPHAEKLYQMIDNSLNGL
jgi:hypothetical protein